MKLANAKLGTKLYGAFAVVLGLMVLIATVGITQLKGVKDDLEEIVNNGNVKLSMANNMIDEINVIARAIRNVILVRDDTLRKDEAQRIANARAKFQQAFEQLSRMVTSDRGKELLAGVRKDQDMVRPITDRSLAFALENKREEATRVLLEELRQPQRKLLEEIGKLINYQEEVTRKSAEQAVAEYSFARNMIIAISAVAILVGLAIAFFLSRGVTRSLHKVIDGLSEGATQVISASGQISGASQSLAEGASQQAAAIEETSSSLEEISSMTKLNADNAGQADSRMKEAGRVLDEASNSMKDLIHSMQEITQASEDTSKIIKSIDEIAFQTNLLALNAAVEAARAGEAGAGFAVVADEVRNLAMRAADAAKNTANLIEMTIKKVKDGSELVSKTNESFVRMSSTASGVAELVGEIAAASREQSLGIEQVNKAVAEMDKVVQHNAANAEENAAASEEMNAQAYQMQTFVEDLSAIVGGSGLNRHKDKGGHRAAPIAGAKVSKVDRKLLASVQSSTTGGYGNGNDERHARPKRLEKRPERLLPLDDAELSSF